MKELLELMDVPSASGHENAIRTYLIKKIKPYCTDMKVDRFGNIIIHKKGKGPSVMLVAHMDEIGLMVKKINSDGSLGIAFVGDMDPLSCLNQKVLLYPDGKKTLRGVITTQKLSSGEDITELPKKDDLLIDTGLSKKEILKHGVEIGTFVEFERHAQCLGSDDYIMGKAIDDRAGCYIFLELIKKMKSFPGEIYFVFTVEEEIGMYGSKNSVYNINPQWALVLDTLTANDLNSDVTRSIGKGPILSIMDSDMLSNSRLNNVIKTVAKRKKLPLQRGVSDFGTTDALYISLSKGGIPTSILSLPVRDMHTNIGIVHRRDVLQTITLIEEILKHPPKMSL